MIGYLIEMFFVSLLLTVLTECAAAAIMGIFSPRRLGLVVLVNLLTNPVAVLLAWLWRTYAGVLLGQWGSSRLIYGLFLGVIELCVVAVEALIYRRHMEDIKHPWLLSLIANSCSFFIGLL